MAHNKAPSKRHVPRLYVPVSLHSGAQLVFSEEQTHHLLHVLRCDEGAPLEVFNEREGEWSCTLKKNGKKTWIGVVGDQKRSPSPPCDLDYLFAPLKPDRMEYVIQKATEMGCARLCPVETARTQKGRFSFERAEKNKIAAAQQGGLLFLPTLLPLRSLPEVLSSWEEDRLLLWCDEGASLASSGFIPSPKETLSHLSSQKLAVLVGPEGGFTEEERNLLRSLPYSRALSLGPRILRADTAAVAALALVQTFWGDWHPPKDRHLPSS